MTATVPSMAPQLSLQLFFAFYCPIMVLPAIVAYLLRLRAQRRACFAERSRDLEIISLLSKPEEEKGAAELELWLERDNNEAAAELRRPRASRRNLGTRTPRSSHSFRTINACTGSYFSAFAIQSIAALFCIHGFSSIFGLNCFFSVASLNSIFSVCSINSAFSIGCVNSGWAICSSACINWIPNWWWNA